MTYDLSPIIDLCIARCQKLAMCGNFYAPRSWLEAGCDMQKDILPVMNRLLDKNLNVSTFSYFTRAVMEARDARIATEKLAEAKKAREGTDAEAEYMKRLAWLRQYSPGNYTKYKHELEAYEARNRSIDTGA